MRPTIFCLKFDGYGFTLINLMDIGYGALYSHLQMRSVQSLLQHLPTGSGDFKTFVYCIYSCNPHFNTLVNAPAL